MFKIRVPAGSGSGESFPDLQMAAFLLCPHMEEREQSLSLPLLIRPLIPS